MRTPTPSPVQRTSRVSLDSHFTGRLTFAAAVASLSLSGCQGITGVAPAAQIRIIDASPDAPALDIYQGPTPLAYNLALGTITSYVPVAAGASSILADLSGTHQHLVAASPSLIPGAQYTVLVGNYTNSLHQLILKDQTQPAPAGQVALRFLHQSARAGALDLYLIPAGATLFGLHPIVANAAFNLNTGYLPLPAGTFTLVALPAGTVPTTAVAISYSGPAIPYPSGTVRTIVLIDQPPGLIQAVVASDFDPAAPLN